MRVIINALLAAAIAYAAILLLVFLFQPRLIYFPQVERELTATPRAAGLDYEDVSLADRGRREAARLVGAGAASRAGPCC